MARATWLADVLTDAGLTIRPYTGWETRGRDTFNPQGVMWHHTVTSPNRTDISVDKFLVAGRIDLAGPLCNYSTNRDGTVSIIAAGVANHGGTGVWKNVRGNQFWFGDEMKNAGIPGVEPWPARQIESARIAAAAILNHLEQSDAGMLCAHKEYATPPGRKTDPHTLNMNTERQRVTEWMEEMMAWTKPGDPIKNLADVKAVHAYQGNQVLSAADIDYVETNPALLDNRWKIITARLLDIDMR